MADPARLAPLKALWRSDDFAQHDALLDERCIAALTRCVLTDDPVEAEAARHHLRGLMEARAFPQALLNAVAQQEAQQYARNARVHDDTPDRSRFFGSPHFFGRGNGAA